MHTKLEASDPKRVILACSLQNVGKHSKLVLVLYKGPSWGQIILVLLWESHATLPKKIKLLASSNSFEYT